MDSSIWRFRQGRAITAGSFKFIQHRNAVKQMPGIDHQGHGERLDWIKGSQQHVYCDKLRGTGKNRY